jgi:cytochrome c
MRSTTYLFGNKNSLLIGYMIFATFYLLGCDNKPEQNNTGRKIDSIKPIPGKDDSIPAEVVQQGEVLIAYSDCYTCHKEDQKSVGPAFKDIAKRYPANKAYIDMLAQKVILGGSGIWGSPVMTPHPKLSIENAKLMVTYILSMEE